MLQKPVFALPGCQRVSVNTLLCDTLALAEYRSNSRGRELNPNIFFSNFSGKSRDIPAKSRDIPPKKFDSLGFEGHTELFGPHPFTWKTPTPPENIWTQKFRFGFFFRA